MTSQEKKKLIFDFLQTENLCVIASVNADGAPESALVGFQCLEDLQLIFGTFASFRKYKNIKNNPKVAFVMSDFDHVTVQYEGKATEVIGEELQKTMQQYIQKYPTAQKYIQNSEERFFKVTPQWVRYTNLDVNPEQVLEVKF